MMAFEDISATHISQFLPCQHKTGKLKELILDTYTKYFKSLWHF